jgi:hypothetical protein
LFLDEAYALMDSAAGVGGAGDAFSQEALRRASWGYPTRSPGFPIDVVGLLRSHQLTQLQSQNCSIEIAALRTLLTEVENHRTTLMVVLAGYKASICPVADVSWSRWFGDV